MNNGKLHFGLWGVLPLLFTTLATAQMKPTRLRCEYADRPIGMDVAEPRLSWELASDERAQVQTAYQVLVAGSLDAIDADRGDLWDSGKVISDVSVHVVYGGKPLASGQRVYWKVRVWDKNGQASAYCEPVFWEMGLLWQEDWAGQWICEDAPLPTQLEDFYEEHPAPLFRREIEIVKPIARARAYVSGLGYYELRLNGERVGDSLLDPAWTTYSKRVLYSTYDVTEMLRQGGNAVGIMVGNGWYNPLPMKMWGRYNIRDYLTVGRPRAILQLDIEYADGSRQSVVTDSDWKVGQGPILKNSVYLGEVYDARREQGGWDQPGFDDSGWKPAVVADEPIGPLHAQSLSPIRVTRSLKPVDLAEPEPGVYLFDMGQNFSGWVRLRISGKAGTTVSLRYGELLYPDGRLNPMTTVAGQIKKIDIGGPGAPDLACQVDTYILKGIGEEVYVPRFTFHGFRYVEVTGLDKRPSLDALEGLRLNSDVESVGNFACSNKMFNRISEMYEWTQLSNMFGLQSDCPHREKFGYGGDTVAAGEAAILNFDMSRFYAKVVCDYADAVRPNGGMTETSPFVGIDGDDGGLGDQVGPPGWGLAHPLVQWWLYRYYGDRRLLAEQYDTTKRWIQFLQTKAVDHILDAGLSDHESLVPKPVALTGTAFYYYNVYLFVQIAQVLGRTDDVRNYATLAEQIKQAFNERFLKKGTGCYDIATQAAQAFALFMDLVPADERVKTLDVLVDDIMTKHKGHLSTGIYGTNYMLNVLTRMGRSDVAYTLANQKDFPGWGFMIANGATTLWEHWAFSDNVYSHNHSMFGSVCEWFVEALAGINVDADAVGCDKITIAPQVVGDLAWAKGTYDSVRGHVQSHWQIEGDTFTLDVAIPVGTTATVYVPATSPDAVTESGVRAEMGEGVTLLQTGPRSVLYKIASGRYKFVVQGFDRRQWSSVIMSEERNNP